MTGLRHRLRRIPPPVVGGLILVAVVIAFVTIVFPLFETAGVQVAEVDGGLPQHVTAHTENVINVSIDNTGTSIISPICIAAKAYPTLQFETATFDNVDTVKFVNGEACGGQLNGQETISVDITLKTGAPGSTRMTLTADQGTRALGAPLTGTVAVGS